jgi:hypothetical protein
MPATIRTRTAAILALAAALLLLTLTACAGASTTSEAEPRDTSMPEVTPEATAEATPADTAALEARARSYLLTLEDLPVGWTVEPPDPGSDDPEYPGDIPPECDTFINDESLPGTLVEVESDDFTVEDGPTVGSTATIMEGPDAAAEAFDLFHRTLTACHDTFVDVFRYYFEQGAAEGADIDGEHVEVTILDVTSEEVTFPVYGDGTIAWRIGAVIQYGDIAVPVVIDFIAVRAGEAVASLTYTYTINAPDALRHQQELAALLEQKLKTPAP